MRNKKFTREEFEGFRSSLRYPSAVKFVMNKREMTIFEFREAIAEHDEVLSKLVGNWAAACTQLERHLNSELGKASSPEPVHVGPGGGAF